MRSKNPKTLENEPTITGALIHELFEAQARRTPDALALVFGDHQLSYFQLNRRANQVAHHLQKLGVGPETLVGLCVERSLEMIVGLLGVLKAGGAYLPLDPKYPEERLAYMLADANIPILLTQQNLTVNLPSVHQAHIVYLDADRQAIERESDENTVSGVQADNLAYVIYTSGSTGRPKGVLGTHRGIENLAEAQADTFGVQPNSRVLQFASLNFDASLSEIVTTWVRGAALHIAHPDWLLPGAPLAQLLRSSKINIVTLPPSALATLPPDDLPDLQTIVSAGEACSTALVERWGRGRRFINGYGPTETTVCASMATLDGQDTQPPSIGKPIANTQVYILDEHLNPTPVGVTGELYVGGVGLTRGYLNRPDLTAERFIPNPFLTKNQVPMTEIGFRLEPALNGSEGSSALRLYKTGDLARWRSDGNIAYIGRSDQQVKVRGFRIELGEIETALSQYPGVQDAVVLAREDQAGAGKRLVAYLVTKHSPLSPHKIRLYLEQKLPAYMLPAVFVQLDALPLLPNGKVNRKALPLPVGERPELPNEFVAPRTALERDLAGIWQEVLGIKPIGVQDNFFELGGDSILVMRAIVRSEQAGLPITPHQLFQHKTIVSLAALFEDASTQGIGRTILQQAAPVIRRVPRVGALPLSFNQQQLWLVNQLEPDNTAYNMPFSLRLVGLLDRAALENSLNEIVQRHEALRTTINLRDGQPVQQINAFTVDLSPVDLSVLSEDERQAKMQYILPEEVNRPFELDKGPLLRTRLLQFGETEHLLVLTMHHIVIDGWSLDLLCRELSLLYQAFVSNTGLQLPDLPCQYVDFSAWQRAWLQGDRLKAQLDFWKQELNGAPPVLAIQTDYPRPATQTFRGERHPFAIPDTVGNALRTLSQHEAVTLFMTLLATFNLLLYGDTTQRDIVIGSPAANRSQPEIEGLIGYFVNMLALRARLDEALTFQGLLGQIRETALGAYTHAALPFAKLVEELHPRRDPAHNPIFQVTFTLQNHLRPIITPELTMIPVESDTGGALFDLRLEIGEAESGALPGFFEYNIDLFRPATIATLVEQYQTLLECVVANPAQTLSELLASSRIVSRTKPLELAPDHQDGRDSLPEGLNSKKTQLLNRRATLSPEQRALLEKRLQGNNHK